VLFGWRSSGVSLCWGCRRRLGLGDFDCRPGADVFPSAQAGAAAGIRRDTPE